MADDQKPAERKPFLWRWPYVFAALGLLTTVSKFGYDWAVENRGPVLSTSATPNNFALPGEKKTEGQGEVGYECLWEVSITNIGQSPAESVRLNFWDTGHAQLSLLDGTTKEFDFNNVVSVGRLNPGEGLTVRAWLDNPADATKRPPIVGHDGGYGKLRLTTSPPTHLYQDVLMAVLSVGCTGLLIKLVRDEFKREEISKKLADALSGAIQVKADLIEMRTDLEDIRNATGESNSLLESHSKPRSVEVTKATSPRSSRRADK